MRRYIKPARGKEIHYRGYFSYITEAIIHIYHVYNKYPNDKIKVYFDLSDIPGYGKTNIFETCFIHDTEDYYNNISEYVNIELIEQTVRFEPYDETTLTKDKLLITNSIIQEHFKLNEEMQRLFINRHSQIDFTKTIGFHRRTTDMQEVHHIIPIDIDIIFKYLENEEFEYIFLMSDNIYDLQKFKKRYGNKLITFDELSTSNSEKNPFFKENRNQDLINNHIKEIVFGAYTLGLTKKLFCTKSNLSTFSIFSNPNLDYKRLN